MLKSLVSMSSLNIFKAAVQFGISTLIAVFVLPAQYGLITFSLPILQFIALLSDMGLGSAIVRQSNLTAEEGGAAFSFSIAVGAAGALLLALTAWPIELSSHLAGVALVLAGLAVAVFFTIVAGVPRAILERTLNYQTVAAIEGGSVILAASICVFLALSHAGIWSLIGYHISLQTARAVAFYLRSRRTINFNWRWSEVLGLMTFGGWVLATNVLNFAARNAQSLLIGAYLGAAAVGLYGLAYQFMLLPLMAIAWPASAVLLATLSRLQEVGHERIQSAVIAVSHITAVLVVPLMGWIVFGLAWPIVVLLNPRWHGAIGLIETLAPLGALQALAAYNGSVLIARGFGRLQFVVNLISSFMLLAGFVGSLAFGLIVFARVYLIVGGLAALFQIGAKLWAAKISPLRYLRALFVPVAATFAGLAAAWVVGVHPTSWTKWAEATATYGAVVLAIYGLASQSIIGTLRELVTSGNPSASLA